MSRDLTTGTQFAIAQGVVKPILFYEGVFATGTLRLWTGLGTILWNGEQWTGSGALMAISPVKEEDDITANGVRISVSGVSTANLAIALAACRYGLVGRVWLGFLDANESVWADPYLAFEGKLDVPEIDDSGETCTIAVSYEHRLIDLRRPRLWLYTSADQNVRDSTDRGFDYVPSLQDKQLIWGPK